MSGPRLTMAKGRERKYSGSDRRRWPRRNPSDITFLERVTFNQGATVQVINIAPGGMLMESELRLRPHMKVMLQLVTSDNVFKVTGCVLRSSVASLAGTVRYQTAIAFDEPLQILDSGKNGLADRLRSDILTSKMPATLQKSSQSSLPQSTPIDRSKEGPAVLTVLAAE
jgi:hypothetical protein